MMAYKLGGALCAGNSVILKLSEDCPLACLKVGELFLEAGAPKEAFHMLTGYGLGTESHFANNINLYPDDPWLYHPHTI